MTTQINLNIPDEIYQRAEHLAILAHKNVKEILLEAISTSLMPISLSDTKVIQSLETFNDEEIQEITQLQLPNEIDRRLSELLDFQQAGVISLFEKKELEELMQIYEEQLLLKAKGLNEAVKRGIKAPLKP
jgi:hypothetical protein